MLVIGAGGAGLRAAIEASAGGARVGLVCKSLLGKAHTVMAEGGVAAALANVDDRDSWKVHFADTMRGGQYVNNWRMAELHAKEAPERVRELEAWGAVFDRTRDGRILQRNFGGHRYPRLAHVGDRTGLEMIRTLQDHGIHQGIDVFMEFTIVGLIKDGARIAGAFGYDRERGLFHLFRARAVVLGTGGIGRAFKITSNSWEYTGDGQAMAYDVGADLIDMEFVQFHPTGMVWPLSVAGILVTEGVRGEGGILVNKEGRRFMFDDIPENYRPQTADNEEEGWRYCQGDKNARRPPELLTRDHVARCIVREIKEGRGSPHGGVFLDIAWIKKRLPNAEEHIKQKLPSMYHQFMKLADIDITKVPMEVGPTTHYMMGGIRVDGDSQMSSVPGLVCRRRGGRRAAWRQPPGRQLALRPAGLRPARGRVCGQVCQGKWSRSRLTQEQIEESGAAGAGAVRGAIRATPSRPIRSKKSCRSGCRSWSESCGAKRRWLTRWRSSGSSRSGREHVRVEGNRMYNAGWHTAIDLHNLLTVSEAITRAALVRKESRGAHFRDDFPNKDAALGGFNVILRKTPEGDARVDGAAAGHACGTQTDNRGAKVSATTATFKIWRGNAEGGNFREYKARIDEGMVVLDAVHQIQAEQAPDMAVRWNCKAGKCGSCSSEINGMPKLMCMTRLSDLPLDQPITVEPMHTFPLIKDLVTNVSWNFRAKKTLKPFTPRRPTRPTAPGGWSRWTSIASRNSANASNASCARTYATSCASIIWRKSSSARACWSSPRRSRCIRWTPRIACPICARKTASATATSPSAAPRSAPKTSTSPTTRSFR